MNCLLVQFQSVKRSVVIREPINELIVFPASVFEAIYALPISCVSVSPRSQSLPWVSSPSAPPWWAPAPSAPPWRSSALSALHWWTPAPPWWSSAQLLSLSLVYFVYSLVSCFLPLYRGLTLVSPFRTLCIPRLDYCSGYWTTPLLKPSGYCSLNEDPRMP